MSSIAVEAEELSCQSPDPEPPAELLSLPRLEGTVSIGRRRISYAEFGRPHGRPVIWLHGTPGSRRQIPQPARIAAEELNIRLIGVDRPGVGGSTPHLYRNVLSFAADAEVLFRHLGIDDFGMIGMSGGGPYLLGCAHAMPERMRAGVILGGVAPTVGPEAAPGGPVAITRLLHPVLVPMRLPLSAALALLVWLVRPLADPIADVYGRVAPEADRRLLARPDLRAMLLDDILNGSRAGLRAPIDDLLLFGQDWGFSVRDVRVPIQWWHGDTDQLVPFAHGEHMVSLLPDAQLHVLAGESHLGGLTVAEDVLATLAATWDAGTVHEAS